MSLNNLEIGIEYHCPHICTLFVLFENENFLLHAQLHNMFLKHIYYFKTEFPFEDGSYRPRMQPVLKRLNLSNIRIFEKTTTVKSDKTQS